MRIDLYPLLTERRFVSPIWGGDRLAAWLDLPAPRPGRLGETWQTYDTNLVTNGPLAGRSIAAIAQEYGADFVGARSFARNGTDFPLLAKFIDAADRLSIQVHPGDAYAHTREADTGFHGKTEAWYILDADPGADVIYGLSRPSDRDAFAAAVRDGGLEDLLQRVPVAPGDVLFVPAGTIHAINAGIVLFEIQQKSDLTYRVYDYGRRDAQTGQLRELHLEKALDVSDFGPARYGKSVALSLAPGRDLLVACPYFALEQQQIVGGADLGGHGGFEILTLIGGGCTLAWPGGELPLRRGESAVIPAILTGYTLIGDATALRSYVPDMGDLAAALRAAGHPDDQIAATLHP
ncbi:class I mannose-6-phosphate isomerase [Oscillochloris sp. ZM17-4]|uniref:type I phosphomannose isomerase catalytic subunit n=1 Tax=Oscillochloris sp. ZM17-4 TaxID=2866714 RepID=UPI001C7358BB|nr:type I phosphomannose isomerase catalytic subunit [Oscillochloris sp. ZM17-4]MBX0326502.1 class I mannose-6-phosphate isomerase [Oscillochloris sp. ZM17-4]